MMTLVEADRGTLVAVLDRLLPAVVALPAAGAMGVADDILRMASPDDRFGRALLRFLELLGAATGGGFAELAGAAQDEAIATLEAGQAETFSLTLELCYTAYYTRADVHARIGWRTGPLQPLGFALPPFDEAALEITRRRAPFWRKA
jgi:hypothetical protein